MRLSPTLTMMILSLCAGITAVGDAYAQNNTTATPTASSGDNRSRIVTVAPPAQQGAAGTTNANNTAATTNQPTAAQPVIPAPAQNTLTAQQVAPAPVVAPAPSAYPPSPLQTGTIQLSGNSQQPTMMPPQQQMLQPVPAQPVAPTTPAVATDAAATATTSAPVAEAAPAAASNTQGYAPTISGSAIPTSTQQMPNAGIDMSLNPNIVGGYDPNVPPGTVDASGMPVVPYEVQLKQRMEEIQRETRNQAYDQAKRSILPLEGYEIREVLGRLKDTQESIQTPVRPAPKPHNVIKTVSLDPAATPPTIRLFAGNVTTLNIVDMTGEPWPVVDIGFGGPFDVKPPEAGGHVIRITPLKDFASGNLSLRLLKLTTPLTFSLKAGGNTVHYRYDARIPEYGPNAKMPLIDDGIKAVAGDKIITTMLEGVPPKGSEKLTVQGVDGRTSAYRFAGTLYVRTPLSMLSPAWTSSATSGDGMNVYALGDAPVLLLSDKGTLVRARIADTKKSME